MKERIFNYENFLNKRFNRLRIIGEYPPQKYKSRRVQAICDCGIIKDYRLTLIKKNYIKSCGCLRDEK
jgi:hypothetical protein